MGRLLTDWIEAYMEYSNYSEAPDKFHLWTAVSCVAGALQGKISLDQGYFRWPANFYIVFCAPPGIVQKSTTIGIGMDLLRRVPGVKMGPDVVTWQALATTFAQYNVGELMDNGEFDPHSSMTIASSEFGNLLNPNDREMVDFLIHVWDGQRGTFQKVTKSAGNDTIQNPWMNLIACTTPAWLAGNFPEYMIGGGFTSRVIFVYGEEKRSLVAYPGQVIPAGHQERGEKLVKDLEKIALMKGHFKMSREAIAWGEVWYKAHYDEHISKPNGDFLAGYYARKQTHLHKLAMVLCASHTDSQTIEIVDLEKADKMLTVIEEDMPKVFSKIGLTAETAAAQLLLDTLSRLGHMTQQQAFNLFQGKLTYTQFAEVSKSAQSSGRMDMRVVAGEVRYVYVKNSESYSLASSSGVAAKVATGPEAGTAAPPSPGS